MFSWDRCTGKEDLVRLGLDVGWGVWGGPPVPHFININTESSLSKWVDSLILLEGKCFIHLMAFISARSSTLSLAKVLL